MSHVRGRTPRLVAGGAALLCFASLPGSLPVARAHALQGAPAAAPAKPAAPAAAAAGFDPARDLEGFEAARASAYAALYPIDDYAKLLGTELDAAGLAGVRERWNVARAAADTRAAALRADPHASFLFVLEQRLAKHVYFSKVGTALSVGAPTAGVSTAGVSSAGAPSAGTSPAGAAPGAGARPWMLVLQKPSKDDPAYEPRVRAKYAPWFDALQKLLQDRYGAPLALVRRADSAELALAVLPTPGDYDNYLALTSDEHDIVDWPSVYNRKLRAVLAREDPFGKPDSSADVYPVAREFVRAWLHAHDQGPAERTPPPWLSEGLATYVARVPSRKFVDLGTPALDQAALRGLVETAMDETRRKACVLTFSELSHARNWRDLTALFQKRTTALGIPPLKYADWCWQFVQQSVVWTHFLQDGGDTALRTAYGRYLALVLAGKDIDVAESEAFGSATKGLDLRLWTWIFDRAEKTVAGLRVDRNALDALADQFAPKPAAVAGATGAAKPAVPAPAAPAAAAPVKRSPFAPLALAIQDGEVEARHGLALVRARAGEFEAARDALKALAAANPAEPEAGRVTRDIERCEAAITLRAAWLEAVRAKGTRLALVLNGKKVSAPIAKLAEGKIVFGENKSGLTELPLSALDPLELAKDTSEKTDQGAAPAWTRSFLFLLCGDARWDRLLKDDSPAGKALRADAASLADALRTGQLARTIEDLAHAPAPVNTAEHEATVAAIGKILQTPPAGHALIVARVPQLHEFALGSLELLANAISPAKFLHAPMEDLGGGRAKVVYEFKDAAELQDVVLLPGFDASMREHLNRTNADMPVAKAAPVAALDRGALTLRGSAAWRIAIPISAPFTVQLKMYWKDNADELFAGSHLYVRVCDDEKERNLSFHNSGSVGVDAGSAGSKHVAPVGDWIYFAGKSNTWRIDHDGKEWHFGRDGEERLKGTAGGLTTGSLIVFLHGPETICFDSIEIVGAFDGNGCAPQRKEWVADRLARLGFK